MNQLEFHGENRKKHRILSVLTGLLSVVLLTACLTGSATPAIESAVLSESEQALLTSAGVERHFMFDVNLDQIPYDRMEYFIDYYEKGKFVEHLVHGEMGGFLTEGKHLLNWSQSRMGNTTREEVWTVSFAGSRITKNVELPVVISAMAWSQADEVEMITQGEPAMLAAIVGSESGELRVPGVIFDETEGGIQALGQYDSVYVFSVTFH